jgi:acetylornithine deacetylase
VGLKERIDAEIDRTRGELIDWLGQLIRIPSVTGGEGPAQAFVVDALRALDLPVDVWELDARELEGRHGYGQTDLDYAGRPNMVARLAGTGGGRSLILNGHVDVVPIEDPALWTRDPWSGEVIDGRVYGRGASDMKASLASMLWALRALRATTRLRGDVLFESVVDEESTGNGTLATLARGYLADAAIVGEPTSLDLVPGHQGLFWFRLSTPGISAHGAYRTRGVNAIEKASALYWGLRELEGRRNRGERVARYQHLFEHVDVAAPISVGRLAAGHWPGTVPDLAVLEGRFGVWLGETVEQAKAELAAEVQRLADEDPFLREHPPTLEFFGANGDSAILALDHPFAVVVGDVLRGVNPGYRVWAQTPGNDLRHMIAHGVPCVMVGPGDDPLSHTANESADVELIVQAAKFYAHLALDWCG